MRDKKQDDVRSFDSVRRFREDGVGLAFKGWRQLSDMRFHDENFAHFGIRKMLCNSEGRAFAQIVDIRLIGEPKTSDDRGLEPGRMCFDFGDDVIRFAALAAVASTDFSDFRPVSGAKITRKDTRSPSCCSGVEKLVPIKPQRGGGGYDLNQTA
ncbi:MAG: hypothetical protein OXT01_05495, partial [Rhodospirillaceae bacterium]|nr:hypothetical protein [Rhodospirillaceae bacterium]